MQHHFTEGHMMVGGMLLFLAVFLGASVKVFWRSSDSYSRIAGLPLEQDEVKHG